MKIANYRYIKALQLPAGWVEDSPTSPESSLQSNRSFYPLDNSAVKIELFYRGFPVSENAALHLDKVLKAAPRLIFDHQEKGNLLEIDIKTICDLEEVLGNVGNNQISNTGLGVQGAPFVLKRLEALVWKTKPVIAVRGSFIDPEERRDINEFCGFFVDIHSSDGFCNVEEIYLETQTEDLLVKYLPVFKDCLNSLEIFSI